MVIVDPSTIEAPEAMGTKRKHWFRDQRLHRSLFKVTRAGTGEDWAEKIAAELASKIGLPHAHYELGLSGSDRGSVSPTFVSEASALIHGNELLLAFDPEYVEFDSIARKADYTVDRVLQVIASAGVELPHEFDPSAEIKSAGDLLTGYLMLDALIGNTDRHHENWAVIERRTNSGVFRYLAPTFDHASSLGRNEPEDRVVLRVSTTDATATVEAYASRAKSPFFGDSGQQMSPLAVFTRAARHHPHAARVWTNQLRRVTDSAIAEIVGRVPPLLITPAMRTFVERFLRFNRQQLFQLSIEPR